MTAAALAFARGSQRRIRGALFAVLLCAAALLAGATLTTFAGDAALFLLAPVLLVLFVRAPVALAVLAVPGVFLVRRLPLGSGLSVSDALLLVAAAASLPALVFLPTVPSFSALRRWLLVFVAGMSVSVAFHPSARAMLELLHRVLLVAGALGVGAWIAAEHRTRTALRLLVAASVVVAVAAIGYTLQHSLAPAYVLGYQKNYIGSVLVLVLLLLIVAPQEVALPNWLHLLTLALLAGGALASQSKGAMVGGATGLLAASVLSSRRGGTFGRRSVVLAATAAVLLGGVSYGLVSNQLQDTQQNVQNSSFGVRRDVQKVTRQLWQEQPVTGQGIRYFLDPKIAARSRFVQAPTNVVEEALAEGGVVQGVALVLFFVGSLTVVARPRHPLALAAFALLVARLTHGMFDIFWTAGNTALIWIVAGMGLWTAAAEPQEAKISLSAAASTTGQA